MGSTSVHHWVASPVSRMNKARSRADLLFSKELEISIDLCKVLHNF